MPPEDLNRDKPKISVYAILLILAFIFTATSIGFVVYELQNDYQWNVQEGGGGGDDVGGGVVGGGEEITE